MSNEDDSSVSEDFDESIDLDELTSHVKDISTKIQRKKENLNEFVSSMKKENSINKTVFKRFQDLEDAFKEGRKSKAELKELQSSLDDRIKEVNVKLESIESALQYISSKQLNITSVKEEIFNSFEDEKPLEELLKFRNEVHSLFSEIKIKFRECKKVKLSLLTKFKPEDLIQSLKSWEKAAEVARDINRKINELQKELHHKNAVIEKIEDELKQEKENVREQEQELLRLAEDIKIEDESKREQAVLINTFRSLLDESEKLVRNLEAQNGNLNQIILDEKNRVSDLRGKLSGLQEQIEDERKSNREMSLKFEHMKVEFHTSRSENEGYKRDLEMISKELTGIKETKDNVSKKETKPVYEEGSSRDSLEELEENLVVKDKLLNEKYFEVEQLKSELEKSSKRVRELENKVSLITEDKRAVKDKLLVKEREVEELTDIMGDTQAALESEKLAKDQFMIKCEMLERKKSLIELQLQDSFEKDGKADYEEMEKEIDNLRELLEEERYKVAERSSLVEELEEQLKAYEELREYEEDIKTRSIENSVHAELENRKLVEIVEDLRERLSEKDSGIEELIAHCAVEELKLREEVVELTNQLQIYKRDCVYKANIIERLRKQINSHKSGLAIVNEEEEDTETDLLVKAAALERELHEERIKSKKYEEAFSALKEEYKEADGVIRKKDQELSKKSAEDGKRIAELLQELEFEKKVILDLKEQIENLEEMISLKEVMDAMDTGAADTVIENELKNMKDDYAVKKLRRKDDLISELRQQVESLKNQIDIEEKRLRKQEALIVDLNDAHMKEEEKISALENENSSQKEYIEELSERVTEGQRLISELEGVADRERMRVSTIEQLILQDKQEYSEHLDDVKDLKKKVKNYQKNIGELRNKVDRINRNLPAIFSPRENIKESLAESSSGTISGLQTKISVQKSFIKDLAENMSLVEGKNEELDAELKKQRGKNIEQDEKIDLLLAKSKECEDLVEYMKEELELVRKRYQGLSGSSDNDSFPTLDQKIISEDIQETAEEELQAGRTLLFPLMDDECENEGDDEHEEGDSGETVYFDDESEKQDGESHAEEQKSNITKQRELIHHLLIFEKVFEQIFAEEGRRIDVVLEKFRSVIHKNTELIIILQNLRDSLDKAKTENERKEKELNQMKQEIEFLKEENKEKKKFNEQQNTIEELSEDLEDKINKVNQLTESLSVEQLLKLEYEKEINDLQSKIVDERESSEELRETVEREINARYEFEVKMREIEEEAYNSASIINELQKDLETERKCYGIVTERLQDEQRKFNELESYVKEAEESANNDKELVEELRKNLSIEEKQKKDFLNKVEKLEKESIEKDEEINNLMNQLGNERNKMEGLFAEIDLEKMTKAKAEAKLQELEEHFSRDELIFDELRRNIVSENAKTREISELFDKERERNLDLEEKTKELEKQVLMDLELFDELKTTIEQEREHNRELDALLSEKSSAYNNRDKLLSELDNQLAETRATIKEEQRRNEELSQKIKKQTENEDAVKDLQEMLKSQIIYAEELDQMALKLKETNEKQSQKIESLENTLEKLKEISAQVSKELQDDLEDWGELDDENDELDTGELDINENIDYSTARNALRLKTLLKNELTIKKKLMNQADDHKKQLNEDNKIILQLNEAIESHLESVQTTKEALNEERKLREESEIKLNKIENELQEERKHVDSYKSDLRNVEQLYHDMSKEHNKKNTEIEKLSKSIEEKVKGNENIIQNLQTENKKVVKEKKEKEEECELMKSYYEEEHKFAKERLEQNQFLKKQIEELQKTAGEKEVILSKLKGEKDNLSLRAEETNANFQKQANVLKELKVQLKNVETKEEYIKQLQTEIKELSHSRRRKKDTTKKEDADTQSKNFKEDLKDIKDEFDVLETEISQKDEEIKKLNTECLEATSKNKESEKYALVLQNEIDHFKHLLKQHEAHAQKSANALTKARLLCELLQTDVEIKDLTICELNSDVHSLTSQLKEKLPNNKKGEVGNFDRIPLTSEVKKYEVEQLVKKSGSEFEVMLPIECQQDDVSKGKDRQSNILREQIIHMATAMEKNKEHNERVIKEKDKEIEKQEKTISMIKDLYYSLKNEMKRDEIVSDIQLLLPVKEMNDATFIIKELECQLRTMKDDINHKTETIKGLKENIVEIKRDDNEKDKSLLSRKENVHRLLSIQLEEKEKKLKRMENLLEGLKRIYYGNESDIEPSSEENVCSAESWDVEDTALLSEDSTESIDPERMLLKEEQDIQIKNLQSDDIVPRVIEEDESGTELQEKKEVIIEDEKNSEFSQDGIGKISTDSSEIPSRNIKVPSSSEIIPHKDFPRSGWKAKLFAYIIIGIGLSFLPHYLKINTLRAVLAFVATPLFFLLSAIEIKNYRKKAESFMINHGIREKSLSESNLNDDVTDYLIKEERKLRMESDQKLIQGLQEQLQQEIRAHAEKGKESKEKDEIDILREQKEKVDYLEKMLHTLEKTKIEEQKQSKMSFDEYIKLRNAVEDLKQKRDLESNSKFELPHTNLTSVNLDDDLRAFAFLPRALPLWVGLAVVIYYIMGLHPVASCGTVILLTLNTVNSWYKIKNLKNKLLEERETARYNSEELEELTELLEKEQEVVESQKAAIDIMVREIDNEYVIRKGKAVTLAKMIMQIKELEEMRSALKEENMLQGKDSEIEVAIQNISKEKAAERVQMYLEMSRKLPELEEESLDNLEATENLNETAKELIKSAEDRLNGNRNQKSTANSVTPGKSVLVRKLITVAMVTLSSTALVTSLILNSYLPAALIAIQQVIYYFSQSQTKTGLQNPSSEELKAKLDHEVKRNKANRLQIGKLKRLLETEKSLKKSDDCAKEIRLRVAKRDEKRKLESGVPIK